MKIEKLTEDKIRVIINSDELGFNHANVHTILTKAIETQEIFSDILKKAEKEVDFHTDGCKLLIEAFSSLDDIVVFTITKFSYDSNKKRKLIAKRKSFNQTNPQAICCFENFDTFCEFCNAIKNIHNGIDYNKLSKNSTLYLWKNTYYLVLNNIHTKCQNVNLLYSILSEFGKLISFSSNFEYKLLEHGKVLIKKNAITIGINFFIC